nr:MAG: RNA-dependent RNA polymerase [Owegonang virus 9]
MVGFRRRVVSKVHHARPWVDCPDRALVWVLPQYKVWDHELLPSEFCVRRLSRVGFTDATRPDWNTLVYTESGVKMINFGRAGETACATMKKADFDAVMALGSEQSVTTRCLQMQISDQPRLSLIGQYYKKAPGISSNPADIARPHQLRVHWPLTSYVDRPEVNYREYSSPIVSDVNMVPMIKRWESLSKSIDFRITKYINPTRITARYQNYYHEFSRQVVPDHFAKKGEPYTWEQAAALLNKPSQVNAVKRIWETVDAPHRQKIEAFLKKEPTNKPGRIISSFADARFLLGFSRFTLALRDVVLHDEHNRHWFLPGTTPSEIAKAVQEYAQQEPDISEGDFENLDGTTSTDMQYGIRQSAFRYFHPRYHKEMLTYWDMLISCPAAAKSFGFAYDPGPGVRSGSPTTCDENTLQNGFTQYCAVRMTRPELAPADAFRLIGMCFGDDSLFGSVYGKSWNKACRELGLTLKVEKCMPDTGVTFLARVFPNPWETLTSFQDPLRTFRKLHLTGRDPNVPLGSAAVDRLRGYLTTDGLTPVISQYCKSVVAWYENVEGAETKEEREKRVSMYSEQPYWLTVGGNWPQDERDYDLMMKCITARTGMSEQVLGNLIQSLESEHFTPWDNFTVNRDEEPVPYRGTLDSDGLPVESVDLRELERERDNVNRRAMPNRTTTPRSSEGSAGAVGGSPAHCSNREGERGERPRTIAVPRAPLWLRPRPRLLLLSRIVTGLPALPAEWPRPLPRPPLGLNTVARVASA